MVNRCMGHIDVEERVRIRGENVGTCYIQITCTHTHREQGEEGWGLQAAFPECILLTRHAFGYFKAKHVFVEYNSRMAAEKTTQKEDWVR